MALRALIARLPLMLKALVLVPLLSAGIDQARVSLACGPEVKSCLETAGQGRFGAAGTLILIAYALAIAGLVGKLAGGRRPGALLWIVATAGLWAACGGQAILVGLLTHGAVLGGGWVQLVAFAAVAGAALAFAFKALPEAIRALSPSAPRLHTTTEIVRRHLVPAAVPPLLRLTRLARDRAPPAAA